MNLRKPVVFLLLGCISVLAYAEDSVEIRGELRNYDSPTRRHPRGKHHPRRHRQPDDTLTINSPKAGDSTRGNTVKVSLSLGFGLKPESLRVQLNGKDITDQFFRGPCNRQSCKEKAQLTIPDGLRNGENQLRASAGGFDNHVELERVRFDYSSGLLGDTTNKPHWLPSSIGFKLTPGGAQPWASLTTGTPAGLQDNIDQTQFSTPYPDITFPGSDQACSDVYQVLVLDRQNPVEKIAYSCLGDSASLKSYLSGLNAGKEIVIVGTTQGKNADGNLDTTGIGGRDYTKTSDRPLGYAAIGVPGAATGSAFESYYTTSEVGKLFRRDPAANGLLAKDQNANYNFHPGTNVQFEVIPNNPQHSNRSTFSYNDGTTRAYSAGLSKNGFWLLILDRTTYQPIDASKDKTTTCPADQSNEDGCGTVYLTGSSDAATATDAIANLTSALNNVTPRQLAVLTTVGQPFSIPALITPALMLAVDRLGGAGYTVGYLRTSGNTYTLVAPGPGDTKQTPFSKGVVNSSSIYSGQKQTGLVRGVMVRNNQNLYFPSLSSQEDGKYNNTGAQSLTINYDFNRIAGQDMIDWPLTDTPAHIAAYHALSAAYLQDTGSHSQDVRWYYAGEPEIVTRNLSNLAPNSKVITYPGDGHGYTQQDWNDAYAQIYTELTALSDADDYLGENGIEGLITGNSGDGGVGTTMIEATYEVLKNQVGSPSSSVGASPFDWLNLLAGMTSILAATLGPLDIPLAAAAVGVTSGALWSGSALGPFFGSDPATPPSYENTFDVTLGQLSANTAAYASQLAESYAIALDNIYSDWSKLQAVGNNIRNSDSGWGFDSQIDKVSFAEAFSAGVRRSIYLQLLPKFYQTDAYYDLPVYDPAKIGSLDYHASGGRGGGSITVRCSAVYDTLPNGGDIVYLSPGHYGSGYDIFVIGGAANQDSRPSQSLLDTLFGTTDGHLNIPLDLVYTSTGFFTRRPGNIPGNGGICYKPGCSTILGYSDETCVGP